MSAAPTCRSDCRAQVAQVVVAVSGSGRRWSSYACRDDDHLATAYASVRSLGFEVDEVIDLDRI